MFAVLAVLMFACTGFSQTITQTIGGSVYDKQSGEPLPFATVLVQGSDPVLGTTTGIDGNFELKNVPVGRISLRVSMIGYATSEVNELLVSSGSPLQIHIGLSPSVAELGGVEIKVRKDESLNPMTTVSSRQFTVEETQRYAGGMNDPARLASAFAGVATPSVSSNGISVRGNSPNGLLWQIEGVEVPNPNHFANLTVVGGGLLSAISNQVMDNSDFLTGAFPAVYGNAGSGVFDIHLKTGNSLERSYTLQAGLLGVDFSTEGPFVKGKKSSYLMNYRNSTMALIAPLLPDNTGILKYQDLAFKTNFPTRNAGTFSFWGIGALDGQDMEAADIADWEMDADRDNSETSMYMFAGGMTHRIMINASTCLKTTFSATGSGLSHEEVRVDRNLMEHPQSDAATSNWRLGVQSSLNHRFGKRHSNVTGFKYSYMAYDVDISQSLGEGQLPVDLAKDKGNTGLVQVFTQSMIDISPEFTLNAGVHSQIFLLYSSFSIEPRIGLKYRIDEANSLGLACGLHSRIEELPVYFVDHNGDHPNKDLDLMKSMHVVLSYNRKINDHLRFSIEPYFQCLTGVPVSPEGYLSTVNFEEELYFDEVLVSEGTGRNLGVDITLERFLDRGFYYLVTASVFDSKYTGADGIERNTRFNRNFVMNLVAGKEWTVGRSDNKLLGANVRLNYLGGNRREPVDVEASNLAGEVIYAEQNGRLAFSEKFDAQPIVSFNMSYRINKMHHASVWSLQVMNLLGTKEFDTDFYNLKTGTVDTRFAAIMIPNISYRIEF